MYLESCLGLAAYAVWFEIIFRGPDPKNSEVMEFQLSFTREFVVEGPTWACIGMHPS